MYYVAYILQYWVPDLDRCLWKVVRVSQFCCHVETEVLGVLNGAVSQLDADAATLLEGLFEQQGLQDGVYLLPNVLQEDRRPKLDAVLERADKVAVCQFDDVEVVGLLHVLDPLVGLALWVNQQGPPTSIAARTEPTQYIWCVSRMYTYTPDDDAILYGERVCGQSSNIPLTNLHLFTP